MSAAVARIATPHAGKYLQQVCKHWEHNLAVTFDAQRGTVTFPRDARGASWAGDAVVTFTAHPETLECHIAASEPGQLGGLKGAVERHIDRFAFRETLVWEWSDPDE
ncbi:MAG: DUF2218 domain-containing protein [Novosphingobium sp.]|nr:DUF2218 domain-containing protein [Novosphingobium sp.]